MELQANPRPGRTVRTVMCVSAARLCKGAPVAVLMPLPTPVKSWDNVIMDRVTHLPETVQVTATRGPSKVFLALAIAIQVS